MSKSRRIHLIVGVALILFSFGLIFPIAPLFNLYFDNSGITLGMQIFFLLAFVFVGGYEIGKYAEIHHNQQKNIPT